jgi:hypothetical protein
MLDNLRNVLKERWPGIFENALYDAIVRLGAAMGLGAAFTVAVGWIKGISVLALLNVFAIVLVSTLFLMVFVQLRRMGSQFGQAQGIFLEGVTVGAEAKLLPSEISPNDVVNRDKLIFPLCKCAQPAYAAAHPVTDRLWDLLRNSYDEKDRIIALLVKDHAFAPCHRAALALTDAFDGPDKDNTELLRQRLKESFDAYQRLLDWTNRLVDRFSFPLSEDPGYRLWQENHKTFYHELRRLLEATDFSQLKRVLRGV